ncbi:hypothetical protein ACETK8_08475 [Brevundimonas staleyi]|uniref:Anti-sigma factor n=1 Tax=Brevundimonas staleyi TaxID=74326 RepID=A0ABW0FT79_9CAUL
MTRLDDEILMRRVDGELAPDEVARVDAAAEADPAVAARLEALRGTRAVARAAFPMTADARDADLARMIRSAPAKASPLAGLGAMLAEAFAPRRAAIWGGLATAAFVGGLALGPLIGGRHGGLRIENGGMLADAGLVRVLDTGLAADGADADGRAVGLTFRDQDGAWCRTFSAGEAGVAGLACREGGRWAMRVMAPLDGATGEIRTASSETPAAVLNAVDAVIAGETVDAAAEAAARDGGWR